MIHRSHSQISDRLKELTPITATSKLETMSSVRPPPVRPPRPASKGVVKDTTNEQSNKQVVDAKAELLYQISEGSVSQSVCLCVVVSSASVSPLATM